VRERERARQTEKVCERESKRERERENLGNSSVISEINIFDLDTQSLKLGVVLKWCFIHFGIVCLQM